MPLIFEPYAEDLASRLVEEGPESVLEIAAGTGVVARALLLMGSSSRARPHSCVRESLAG